MYCTNRQWCDFAVCTEVDIHIERIDRDIQWWNEQLLELKVFISTHFCLNLLVQGLRVVEKFVKQFSLTLLTSSVGTRLINLGKVSIVSSGGKSLIKPRGLTAKGRGQESHQAKGSDR